MKQTCPQCLFRFPLLFRLRNKTRGQAGTKQGDTNKDENFAPRSSPQAKLDAGASERVAVRKDMSGDGHECAPVGLSEAKGETFSDGKTDNIQPLCHT